MHPYIIMSENNAVRHTIEDVPHAQVFDHRAIIVSVSNEANHEAALESMLKKVCTVTLH